MTPEEINEINRQIAEWINEDAAKTCVKCLCNLFPTPCTYDCPEYKPADFYTYDAYAYTLLPVLVTRGYVPELSYHNLNWWFKFSLPGYKQPEYFAIRPTISAAICEAVIEVIRKEKR